MDWSVLTDPQARPAKDACAALEELGRDARAGFAQAIGTIVNRKLAEMIHPWFSAGMHEWADVDVYADGMREGILVLHFVADHYNCNFAQSGSDGADHCVFSGAAHVVGGRRTHEAFALEHHVHLTERESESYDRRATVDAVRARLREKRRHEAPEEAAPGRKPIPPGSGRQ